MRLSTSLRLNAQKGLVTPYDPTLTLSLQFAARQAYVSDFGPLPTFTNASTTRTYVGSDGLLKTAATNVPRIEFNPVTRQCLGLLIEEQRANLTARSEDLTIAPWSTGASGAVADQTTAPDGANTADSLAETTANTQHYILNASSVTSGTVYTASVFVKKGNGSTAPDWIAFGFIAAGFGTARASFNMQTGVFGGNTGITATKAVQFQNGWWRISVTATATATTGIGGLLLNFTNNSNTHSSIPGYAGQTTSNVFVWGAQFEAGSFATSYIPTTTAPLTRSADVCSITGAAFTGFYNQTEGAIVLKMDKSEVITLAGGQINYAVFDDGTANNTILLAQRTTGETLRVVDLSIGQALIGLTLAAANQLFGISARYKVNDFAISTNGLSVATDPLGTVPSSLNRFIFSQTGNSIHIRSFQYFNAIKTNAQLQALSTP